VRTLTAETALTHAADVKQEVNATAPPFTHTFVHHQQNHRAPPATRVSPALGCYYLKQTTT
jgi:hypothetical protein